MSIEKLLNLESIYGRSYGLALWGNLLGGGLSLILGFLILPLITFEETSWAFKLTLPIFSLFMLIFLLFSAREFARARYIKKIFKSRPYKQQPITPAGAAIEHSAIKEELSILDRVDMIKATDSWQIYDAIFAAYTRTKWGRYKSREIYYTVFEGKLPRPTPHLLFDSKLAKKQQFKYAYAQSQRMSLDGTFDEFFVTYGPKYYGIDILSFITPEIIEMLIAMKKYDVELIDKKLLCYAPLLPPRKLEEFATRCENLQSHLGRNLATYKDDWLSRAERDGAVSNFGRKLLKNPWQLLPYALISGGLFILWLVAGEGDSLSERLFDQSALVLGGICIAASAAIVKGITSNRQAEQDFLAGKNR